MVDDDAVDHHKLFAYDLSNGNRVANRDINTLQMVGNLAPDGVWSDKTTIWVTDRTDNKLYAYNLSDGTRDSSLDIETLRAAGNGDSSGIWSDGTTVWVADQTDDKLYAYLLPKPEDDSAGVSISRTTLTIDEGSSDTYTVALNTQPSADVTVTISGHSGTDVRLSDTGLNFTPGNWDTAQTVTVTAGQDDDATADTDVTLTHAVTGASEYEAIAADDVPSVLVTITENDSAGVSIVPTTLTIDEGASKTYTVVLDTEPSADVTVTISGHSGTDVSLSDTELDFTPGNWDTAQTVTVTAEQDDDATADTDVTLTHAVTGASEYAAIAADDVPGVLVTITENDSAGVSIVPTTLTIDEGASKTYTVVLDTEPSADVSVTISGHSGTDVRLSDTELDFTPGNWDTAQTVTVTAGQDDDATADTDVTLTHAVTGAGEYAAIAADDVPGVLVKITENDTAGVSIEPTTLTIDEGGSKTYTVVLDTEPSADVKVTISGHTGTDVTLSDTEMDFTADNWNTEQTVTVSAEEDDDTAAESDVTLTHAVTGASEYAAITATDVPRVVVKITENDSAGVSISESTLTIDEGGSETYTVVLDTEPSAEVTVTISGHTGTDVSLSDTELTFTDQDWDTAQTVTVTAEHDDDAAAEAEVTLSHALTGASEYAAIDADDVPSVAVRINEDDSAGVSISESSLTITEGASKTYTVVLDTEPSADVTVTISGHSGSDVTLSDTELDFTADNWNTEQTVTVSAGEDDDTAADTDVTLSHTVTGAGEYAAIDAAAIPRVAVTITENDSAGVSIVPTTLTIGEGGSETYTVVLDTEPSADVSVTISGHAGTDVSLSDTELTFTDQDWDTAQTVKVTAGEDDDATADTDVTLTHAVSGASEYAAIAADDVPSVAVRINEDDSAGVSISESTLTIDEGGSETYTVALNTQPSADVTVTISGHAGTDVSLSDTELTFTAGNWNVPQTVTVTAEHDDDAAADTDVTLTHAVTGASEYATIAAAAIPSVLVTITENDSAGVSISESTLTIDEGASKTYTVVLDTQPNADVTVTISGHAGTDVSLSDTELTFTDGNWDVEQEVTVTAEHDDDTAADSDVTLTHAVTGASEYEAIAADDVPSVAVRINEDDSAGVSIEPTTLTIDEGASKTYTVALNTQPSADVTVTISGHSGTDVSLSDTELDFTPGNWDTAQTVTVTAGQDDDATADTDVTLTHAVTGASEYAAIAADDVPSVAVRINEDDSAGVAISESSLTIVEGGSDTYTVKLNTEPSADVTVTISGHSGTDVSLSDTELTFTDGNWDVEQEVTVTAEHDDDTAADSDVTLTHAVTGASEYEAIAADDVPSVAVRITENDSAGVSIVPTTLTIDEGASKTYTVVLDTEPSADVSVTISGHSGTDVSLSDTELDFTPGNWDTAQTVTVTAGQDDDATADTDVTLTHAVTGASEYEAIAADDVPSVAVRINEDDSAGVAISESSLTIVEGGSDTYTVKLNTEPSADVSVTISGHSGTDVRLSDTELDFTPGNWDTAQTVTVTAGQDDDAAGDTDVTLTHAVTGASEYAAIDAATVPRVVVTITEDDSAGVSISRTTLTINEGGSDTYTVALNTEPSDDVTVTISGHAGTDVTVDNTELTFTAGNWDVPQTVTVTAEHDDDTEAESDVTLSHAVTGASEYAAIDAATVPRVVVKITEDDSAGVTISRTTLTIAEGSSDTYTVKLDTQPSDDVTVTISGHAGTDVRLSDTELDFTPGNWDTAQTVTVTAEEDDDATADTDVTLTHAVSGAGEYAAVDATDVPRVVVKITENDTAGVSIEPTTLTIDEGASKTYTVVLDTQPTADVTVTISGHAGTDLTVDDTELDFTPGNWDTAQTVTVTAGQDDDATADTDVTLTHAVTGASEYAAIAAAAVPSVAVRINEDDSAGVAISESSLTIVEGGSDTYTVKLNTQPSADVTVTISGHAGTDVSLSDTELDFTPGNWDTAQTVTVTAGQDDDATADTDVTLTHAVTGASEYAAIAAAAVPSVSVTITEDDSPGVAISRTTLAINEGGAETYTVVLNTQPSDDVTVTISGHAGTDLTVDDTELTFTDGNWDMEQTVTVTAEEDDDATADSDVTLTHAVTGASEYAAIAADDVPSVSVTINEDDSAGVAISRTTLTITEGASKTYTVVLDTEPSADVTVTISGHAGTDVSLSDTELDFTTGNWDTAQTVTVTAGQDDDATADTDVTLTHAVTGASEYAAITADDVPSVAVRINEDDSAGVSISESSLTIAEGLSDTYTVVLNTEPSADVTVTISGHAGTDVSLSDTELDFTPGNWDTAQTVTVTAEHDDDATADSDVTLTHALTGAGEYAAIAADDVPSVLVTITENDSAGVSISKSTLTIDEGASKTYTVVLDTEPSADVTVTISGHSGTDVSLSDTELDFTTGNWDTAQTVTVTAGEDDDAVSDTDVTLTHAVTGAGEYAAIAADDVPSVSVKINEDDSAGVSISRTLLTIDEGGSDTYTVKLNTQPSADVTVTISGHAGTDVRLSDTELDFTPGNWDTAQTVTVTAGEDDDATADTDVTLTHAVTGASEYAAIAADDVPSVLVKINEDDSAGVSISRTTLTIGEGGTETYTVVLNTEPSADVTVTISGHAGTDVSLSDTELDFTTGNWDTAQTVTVTAGEDDDAVSDTDVTLTHAVTGASEYAAIAADDVPRVVVTITENDTPGVSEDDSAGVSIEPTTLTIDEGGSKTYTVVLDTEPSADVTVTISGHTGTDVSLSGNTLSATNTLTFTTGDWDTAQTVTVTAGEDDDAVSDTDVTLTHAVTGASEYAAIAAADIPVVEVTINENDSAGVSISKSKLNIDEGGSGIYKVALDSEPTVDVTVTISGHTGTDVSLSGDTLSAMNTLTFTAVNWYKAQTVTVTAGHDVDEEDDSGVTLSHAVTGASEYAAIAAASIRRVSVTINDDDVQMTSSTIRDAADYLIPGFVSQSSYEPSVHDPGLWAPGHGNPVPLTIGENAIDQKDLPADGNLFTVECFDKDGRKTDCYEPGTSWGNELASNVVRVEWADIFPNSVVWVHDFPIAQKFRTGSAGPYLLAGLEVHVRDVDAGEEMQVLIARGNGSIGQQIDLLVEEEVSDVVKREVKQDGLYELRLDGALQNGSNTYVAPEGAILESETEYYLFFRATRERVTHVGPRAEVYIDSYPQNQAHRLSDWQIDDQVMTVGLDRSYPALSEDGKVLDYSYSLPSWTPQPGRLAAFPLGLVSGSERVQSLQAVPATSGITVSWTSHSLADRYLLQWRTSNQNWTDAISAGQEKDLSSVVQYQLTVADGHVVQGSTYRIRVLGVSNSFAELFEYSHTTGEVSVGASTQLEASPLTASVESAPEAHDGQSAFRVRIKFSDDLAITPEAMRDEALLVIGGQLTDASPVGGQQDLWELTIEPQGMGPVSIMTTPSGTCQLEGDLCTADGWPLTTGLALQVAGPTPLPTISGTAQVGETLTADTSGIADDDGLSNAVYQYQWLADDVDIAGATAKTYTLVDADEGAAIKVRVSFTDDAGNDETLTSAATAMVESAQPTGSAPDAPRKPNGTAVFIGGVDLEWDDVPGADTYQVQTWRGGQWTDLPGDGVEIAFYGAGAIVSGLDPQSSLWFQVRASNAHGVSAWSGMLFMNATSEFTLGRRARPANVTATGAPVIMGAAEVGETLRVDTTGIEDGNGLDRVRFEYQWTSNDGSGDTDIAGTTQPTYVWSDDEEGGTVSVRVSFVDRLGYAESLSSAAVGAVVAQQQTANSPATGQPTISGTAQVGATLTADTSGISDADGLTNASYSYQWLSDDMDIAGATATTYTLTDADEGAAIKVQVPFTDDAGNDESLTSAATGTVETRPNSPATGQPAISGAAQVGETLTADTSGIVDQDGLTNVAYSYQWLADDADIAGATATAYTLADADEGMAIKLRVSFTDDAGNEESLTSAATDAVTFAVQQQTANTPATGAPEISGTAQVGETLTASTSGIEDEDGLDSVSYSYQWLADDADIAGATATTYTLTDSEEGKALQVRVSFTDDAGHEESLTSAATVSVAAVEPAEPPAPPTGLTAAASHDQVVLSWDDPQDDTITGYVILRRNRATTAPGEFTELVADTGSAATTYTDHSVSAETLYTYRIKAINDHGLSELSRWVRADIPAPPVPAKPTGLTATASHDQVVLSWDDPQDDTITGYVILRRNRATTAPGEFTELVADTGSAANTYTDDSVAADTSYTYRIKAINEHGVSELSRWARADTPEAP